MIKSLDTDADAEARLKTFMALSTALENKDVVFKNATNLNSFLEVLISGMFVYHKSFVYMQRKMNVRNIIHKRISARI